MAFQSVIASIEGDGMWDEIEKVAEQFSDVHAIKNVKKSATKQKRPNGHSFEAVSVLKKKTDLKDAFLIYKANDGSLNEQPSYVFKSSKLRANMAINMDRTEDHVLSKEYCHFDGKHDRCKNCVTLTASVYHPVLRRMVKLPIMECNSENEENLILFWNLLNEVIRRESGNKYTFFDPCGFICDEAGANWASLKSVFGDDVLQRTKGCELHYLQSLHRHANTLNSRKSKHNLKKLGNNLREAATPAGFQAVYDSIVSFINAKHEKRKHLLHWLQWWVERKTHFSKAYRPLHNLSEPVNSSFQRRGHSNISLVDAALEDVAESLLLEKIRFWQSHGEKVYGSGPTQPQLQQRENSNQVRRAEQIIKEIDTYSNTDTVVSRKDAQRTAIIDPQCSHRPTKSKKRMRNSSSCSKKAPAKKRHVSMFDDTDEFSSSSSDQSSSKDSRPRVFRKKKSSIFLKSLEKAKTSRHEIAVSKTLNVSQNERRYAVSSSGKVYHVSVCQVPSCTCPFKLNKPNEVCKHLIWVYLFVLGLQEESNLIQRVGLTKSELNKIFRDAPVSVPNDVLLPEGAEDTNVRAFIRHPINKDAQEWFITRKGHPKTAHCSGLLCFKPIEKGDLHLAVKGLFCPPNKGVAVPTTFRYCISKECIKHKRSRSNILSLENNVVFLDPRARPTDSEMERITSEGFKIKLKINVAEHS